MSQFDERTAELMDRAMVASITADVASAAEDALLASIEAQRLAVRAKYDAARMAQNDAMYELAASQPASVWVDLEAAKELYDFGALSSGETLAYKFLKGFSASFLADVDAPYLNKNNVGSTMSSKLNPISVPTLSVAIPYKAHPDKLAATARVVGSFLVATTAISDEAGVSVLEDNLNRYRSYRISYDRDEQLFEVDGRQFDTMFSVLSYMSEHISYGVEQGRVDDRDPDEDVYYL